MILSLRRFCAANGRLLSFLDDLGRRKLIASTFPSDILNGGQYSTQISCLPAVAYAGFDPTADSLHVGNLLVLNNLLRCLKYKCRIIALIGGATAAIGDPSGRASEREESDRAQVGLRATRISENVRFIAENAANSLGASTSDINIVDNAEWFDKMPAVDFLRLCRPFRIGAMLRTGAVKARMDAENEGLSFTEFSYQTLQSIDWAELAKRYDCLFQIGGSDQLGHLDLGSHFIAKSLQRFAAGVTLPLITDAAGHKLGKSTGAPVWLTADKTSPFHFFQYWRQMPDVDAARVFPMYSLRPMDEVNEVLREHSANLGKWIVQDALAREMTALVHGDVGLEKALACTRALFQGAVDDLQTLSPDEIRALFGAHTNLDRSKIRSVRQLASASRTDLKPAQIDNLIKSGAFKVNGVKCVNPDEVLSSISSIPNLPDIWLLCWGKRKFQIVCWTS